MSELPAFVRAVGDWTVGVLKWNGPLSLTRYLQAYEADKWEKWLNGIFAANCLWVSGLCTVINAVK